uniref:SMP-LTD domain-containing protein n=1 Tax=Stomoxys calcitrans TaxID=35570 RepID=A0A1I8Q7Q7_STOCA
MGTWKMIKGKVSQTIEDIKSSKGSSHTSTTMTPPIYPTVVIKGGEHYQQTPTIEFDSDQETKTSISEDLSMDHDRRSSGGSSKHKRSSKLEDSDTDFENEILLEGDSEHSRLRRGIAHLKSKVKAKHEAHQAKKATLTTAVGPPTAIRGSVKKDTSPSRSTGSSSSSTSLRGTFLRRRRNKGVEQAEQASPTNISPISALAATVASGEMAAAVPVVVSGKPSKKSKSVMEGEKTKKDIEIESGVEMLEDMIPPVASNATDDSGTSVTLQAKREELDLPISQLTHSSQHDVKVLYENNPAANMTPYDSLISSTASRLQQNVPSASGNNLRNSMALILDRAKSLPLLSILGLIAILVLPINDFIRGVFACLLSISIVESIWQFIQSVIEYFTITIKPEKKMFRVPDYSKMSICEVPAVEEFKTYKSYGGWMNEVDSYDPNTFHISMTRPVYIKLDGSILHISNTNARIPKRAMWNEPPIDRKTIVFTTHRSYNLLGCRIELLPIGLARKRHFNRKYPIQLIVKPCKESKYSNDSELQKQSANKHRRFSRHRAKHEKQEAKETSDVKPTQTETVKAEAEIDFAATILNADLQKLQDDVNPDEDLNAITVPVGDEVRILLFARGAREKEDWYRRFVCASNGDVTDQDLHLTNVKLIDDKGLQAAATKAAQMLINPKPRENSTSSAKISIPESQQSSSALTFNVEDNFDAPETKEDAAAENEDDFVDIMLEDSENIEGLLMSAGAARNDADYIKFMSLYQKACRQSRIPVYKGTIFPASHDKRSRKRTVRHENELWKGIDQSLFLGPCGSVVWANVLVGRILFSSLQNEPMLEKLQDILQKKLNSIKLPSFMEDVIIKNIDLGDKPPLLHRVSQPLLDERGLWLDMDVTYEGMCQITVTTKLNLLRLKRPARSSAYMPESNYNLSAQMPNAQYSTLLNNDLASGTSSNNGGGGNVARDDELLPLDIPLAGGGSAIYDSDAESIGSSSTESEGSITGSLGENPNSVGEGSNPGNARRIFKFVDRIATSNFFQYATELSYVQKAMENMSTTITLGIDLHGLVSRVTVNIPPPPSDRIWLAFRAPPRLWLTARPTVGDKSVDWSIVTNVIEGKLCEAVNKYLVYPNMVDLTVPLLGKTAPTE